jgi:propanediol utilization protein
MANYEELIMQLVQAAKSSAAAGASAPSGAADGTDIPVGVSNRHLHLSQADLETLFGAGYELTNIKDLGQPGQFACKETLTVVGPKGAIEKVRVLGPVRKATQVEILAADGFKLGVKAPVRQSGDLAGSPGVTLVGPKGSVVLKEGTIVALRHIHMNLADAARYGVKDGDIVSMEFGGERGGIMNNVLIRANDSSALECHVDTEEANAFGISSKSTFKLIK